MIRYLGPAVYCWVNCSLETCGKRWNRGFSSQFLSLSISILTILLLKILHEGSAERPEHGRSTAYAECTKCAGDAQRCSSWIEWHGVAQLRTECPERRVTDGRDGGGMVGFGWIFFIKTHPLLMIFILNGVGGTKFTSTLFLDFPEFSPQPFGQTWKFSFEANTCRVAEGRKAPAPLWHRRALEFSGGNFPNLQRNTGNWWRFAIDV